MMYIKLVVPRLAPRVHWCQAGSHSYSVTSAESVPASVRKTETHPQVGSEEAISYEKLVPQVLGELSSKKEKGSLPRDQQMRETSTTQAVSCLGT